MTNLLSRLLLLVVAVMVPALALAVLAAPVPRGGTWLVVFGVAVVVAGALLAAEVRVHRPLPRLLDRAERLRAGQLPARTGGGSAFGRFAAALDALALAQEGREDALREALVATEQARSALAESEARLRLALAAADVTVYEIDLARRQVWLDHRASALTGGALPANCWLASGDPRWNDWFAAIHPGERAGRRAALRAVILGRSEAMTATYRVRGADGPWRWLAERAAVVAHRPGGGGPLRIVGIVRDVTEQYDRAAALEYEVTERTAALRESERRFRSIFDSAFQITGLLSCSGCILQINRAALEFLGLEEHEIIGRPICEIGTWTENGTGKMISALVDRAAAGSFVRHEVMMQDRAGKPRTFDFSLKPVFDEVGGVTMVVAEARDVTERLGLRAQLAQAQKMEAVGQLTGGVAHDFNNLLQALTGNLDLIHRLAQAHDDARLLQLTANAQRATARGARLTQQLLAFSRRQNLNPEQVWVHRLVAEMDELLRRAVGETVQVEARAAPDLWPCHLDPAQFESAVLNLAINARDAMPDGGTLAIVAGNMVLDIAAASRLEVPPGDYVRVDVSDTGTGIAPEHLSRLFEPFFTTKEVGKGTGLGLAMVHGFARQSGGTVTVSSEPGRGTTVSLLLPRSPLPARPTLPEPRPSAAVPHGSDPRRLGILVVEDDPEVREAVQFALVDAGHRVLTAADAPDALAVLQNGERLDVLVCDVGLPGGISGLEVARAARRLRPQLRVLLASGYGDDATAGDGYEMMAKPFSQAELLRRVAATDAAAAAN